MKPILARLLGLQQSAASSVMPQEPSPMDEAPVGQIDVVGGDYERPYAERPNYAEQPPRPAIVPKYILNDDRIPPHRSETEEIIPREGMFGIRGTLRDVLGTLGDAFLVQSGNAPAYRQQRQREEVGDAMYGFSQNPLQAIERLTAMGYPEQAAALQQQVQAQAIAEQRAIREQASAEGLLNQRRQKLIESTSDHLRNILYRMDPDQRVPYIQAAQLPGGLTLNDLGIGGMANLDNWIMGGVDVQQGERFIRQDRRLEQGDRRLSQGDRRLEQGDVRNAIANRRLQEQIENADDRNALTERGIQLREEKEARNRPRSRSSGGGSRFGPPRN